MSFGKSKTDDFRSPCQGRSLKSPLNPLTIFVYLKPFFNCKVRSSFHLAFFIPKIEEILKES